MFSHSFYKQCRSFFALLLVGAVLLSGLAWISLLFPEEALPAFAQQEDDAKQETRKTQRQELLPAQVPQIEPSLGNRIHITKRVAMEEIGQDENSIYTFRIRRVDEEGTTLFSQNHKLSLEDGIYEEDKNGYVSETIVVNNLPDGIYIVSEIGGRNYDLSQAGRISSNGTAKGSAVEFVLDSDSADGHSWGSVVFVNEKQAFSYEEQDTQTQRILL